MLLKIFAVLSLPLSLLIVLGLDTALWLLPLVYIGCLVLFVLLAGLFLVAICAAVDMKKPQHEDSRFYRAALYLYIELIMTLARVTVDTQGLERIPQGRRFLLVCNHQNETDPGILHHYFRKSQLAFISKKEAEFYPIAGPMMHKTLCQMVNRENDREALKTILKCIQIIKDDQASIGVFPEGGIYELDKLNPFRSGVFKIAQKAGVPIVVCTLKGTSTILHKLKRLQPIHVRLHLVDIIPDWQVKEMTTIQISERVHKMMLEDLGEEYRLEAQSV